MNAILYLLRTGCPWRYLLRDSFPPLPFSVSPRLEAGPNKIRRRFPWLELIWADGGYNAWPEAL